MSKQSKYERVRRWILAGRSLTSIQALRRFGVYRLAVVIRRMRLDKHNVVTEMVTTKSSTYAKYYLA